MSMFPNQMKWGFSVSQQVSMISHIWSIMSVSLVQRYTKDDDEKYIIVEEEAAVIRRIFDEYEKGTSPTEIAKRLNEDGVPSPAGIGWKIVNVKYILSNPKYGGDILTNARFTENHMTHKQVKNTGQVERIPIKDHHKAIVSKKQFDRVQKIVEMKRTGQYPFMGLMACPICGRMMKKVRPSGNDYYWACEDDRFYIGVNKVEDAVIRAFAQKGKEHPLRLEFWQFDGMIDEITFGNHYGLTDRTVTVIWRDGMETTVQSNVRNLWRMKAFMDKRDQMAKPVRGEKTVTIVNG